MKKEEFIKKLETKLQRDNYGHFKVGNLRVKIQKNSWRFERKPVDRWVKNSGNYFSKTTEKELQNLIERVKDVQINS